jgi:hypothetical protein
MWTLAGLGQNATCRLAQPSLMNVTDQDSRPLLGKSLCRRKPYTGACRRRYQRRFPTQ